MYKNVCRLCNVRYVFQVSFFFWRVRGDEEISFNENGSLLVLQVSDRKFQSTLVIAEHNNQNLASITRNAVTAASKLGNEVSVLVAADSVASVSWLSLTLYFLSIRTSSESLFQIAEQASKLKGVSKVFTAEAADFKGLLPEAVAPLVVATQKELKSSHIVAGCSAFGKSVLPRVAALLDVSPISDVIDIKSADTFIRTIYAGKLWITSSLI